MTVDGFPIGADYCGHVFRALHAAFNFQGSHTGINQFRNEVNGIEIPGREQVGACLITQHILAPFIYQCIRQTAGLGTAAAIAAATANHAAHQALTGIADAKGAVHEYFDFHIRMITDVPDFLE